MREVLSRISRRVPSRRGKEPWRFFPLLIALLIIGCSTPEPTSTPAPTATAVSEQPTVQFLFASTELAAEETRFAFALAAPDGGLIDDATVSLQFLRLTNENATLVQEGEATYRTVEIVEPHIHADGEVHTHIQVSGIYVMDAVQFDTPGPWGVRVQVSLPGTATPVVLDHGILVRETSSTPSLGALVPATRNKTAADVSDLSEISSSVTPNPNLYQTTVADALEREHPVVVVFATPAFCQSRLCGPILEIVTELLSTYKEQVDFIHIEPYDLELLRNESRFQLTDASLEWGLLSEPFVFVVNAQGRLNAKFEGIFTVEELDRAIQQALLVDVSGTP